LLLQKGLNRRWWVLQELWILLQVEIRTFGVIVYSSSRRFLITLRLLLVGFRWTILTYFPDLTWFGRRVFRASFHFTCVWWVSSSLICLLLTGNNILRWNLFATTMRCRLLWTDFCNNLVLCFQVCNFISQFLDLELVLLIWFIHIFCKTFDRLLRLRHLLCSRSIGLITYLIWRVHTILNLLEHYFESLCFTILFLLSHLFSDKSSILLTAITTIIPCMTLILLNNFRAPLTYLIILIFIHNLSSLLWVWWIGASMRRSDLIH
jgi:hypothetical protein